MSDPAFQAANVAALAAAQPGVRLPAASDRVRLVNGTWRLESDGRSVAIHSRDPQREADTRVAQLLTGDTPPTIIVAIGLGLGFLLDALERAGWTGKILAAEPEPATVLPLLSRRDLRPWFEAGRLRLLVAPDYEGASDCWSLFGDGSEEPAVLVNSAIAQMWLSQAEQARALATRLRSEAASNAEAKRKLGARYLLNTLRNLPALGAEADVTALFGSVEKKPAIVVAAGPSLDAALPALRSSQRSAVLICVDTALRPLLAANITPDVVVSVDPSEANARHLTDLPPCPHTWLVAEASLDPFAIAAFRGRTFFFRVSKHHPWPWIEQHGGSAGHLRAWGSVLTTAFDLALEMGCDPIVFAGADLAYTNDRPYCRGVVFEEDWRRRSAWGTPLDEQWASWIDVHPRIIERDVAGQPARTAPHLLAFRNWLLEQLRRRPDRHFVNATGGGILHGPGLEQATFEQLPALLHQHSAPAAETFRQRYRPTGTPLVDAATYLLASSRENKPAPVLEEWERFAPGLSRDCVAVALERAVAPVDASSGQPATPQPPVYAQVVMVDSWLKPLADSVPLVPMRIPSHRMVEWSGVGARMFFFRTMAARLIMCALQAPDGSLTENGVPLKEAASVDEVVIGTYRTCRDELHFRASDDSDPRTNGREYALLVPPCVAELEGLPLQEILDRRL